MINNTFATAMTAVKPQAVIGMLKRVNKALDSRVAFEAAKGTRANIELASAEKQMRQNKTLAKFYAVLKADPDLVINRVRKDGYRANLKTVRKVRMLAEYMAGQNGKVNGVCKALFAATILAARMGKPWVSNNDAEKLILQLPVESMGAELRAAFEELRGLNVRDPKEARNQACQFRTAFENLGCYFVAKSNIDDADERGIIANMESPLIVALAEKWGI